MLTSFKKTIVCEEIAQKSQEEGSFETKGQPIRVPWQKYSNKRHHEFILPLTMELSLSSSSLRISGSSPHFRKFTTNTKCKFYDTVFKFPDNSTLTTNFYSIKRSSNVVSNKFPKQFSITVCSIPSISSWISYILVKFVFRFSKFINFT